MANDLPAIGTVSYNGVTFGTRTKSVIEGKPVYDSAGRTVICVVYTLNIKTTIFAADASTGGTVETAFADIRRKLQTPGGELHYEGKGFGGLTINVPAGGSARDVMWGPKPQILKWDSTGGAQAVELTWVCEVAIPECVQATYQFAPMEFCFTIAWDIDKSRYTRRNYSGHIVIPQTRGGVAVRSLSDQADAYRERIVIPLPQNFRRVEHYELDESKCRLNFSIEDEEMVANVPPPGIIDCQAEHVIQSAEMGGLRWSATLSAWYEVAPDQPKSIAGDAFFNLLQDRVNSMKSYAQWPGTTSQNAAIYTSYTFREPEIYGRRCAAFSVTYAFTTKLDTIIAASGLWRQPPGSNWNQWQAALASGPRGNAGLAFATNQDFIVDLCINQPNLMVAGGRVPSTFTGFPRLPLHSDYPGPDVSWFDYLCKIRIESQDENCEMKTLPVSSMSTTCFFNGDPIPAPNPLPGLPGGGGVFTSVSGPGTTTPNQTNANQTRANQSLWAILSGTALRAGYPITPPALTSINGVPCIPDNREDFEYFESNLVANWGGVPIVEAGWQLRYRLPTFPVGPIGVPESPLTGVTDI